MHTFLIVITIVNLCRSAHLPPTFKKCSRSDSNLNQCFTEAGEDALRQLTVGIPEIGIPCLEPLEIPLLVVGEGENAVKFEQNYQNLKVGGLTKPTSLNASLDLDRNIICFDVDYLEITMDFDYSINGKMLVMPIYGNGTGKITMDEAHYGMTYFLTTYEKNNETYFKVNDTKMTIDAKQVHFNLDNLFNGRKELSDKINEVMNENWEDVFYDVRHNYEKSFGEILMDKLNGFFEKVCISSLFEP